MKSYKVLVLPGDGVGPEVVAEAVKVLKIVESFSETKFDLHHGLIGGCSIDEHGVSLTQEIIDLAKQCDAVLFGACGGLKWESKGIHPEAGLLILRKELNVFANLRPCRFYSKSLLHYSVLRPESVEGTDFIIVRENCGGAYFGNKVEEEDYAMDPWAYTRLEVERVARVAAALAMEHDPPQQVISSDKANVLASGRLWRRVVSETFAKEFPQIKLSHQLADSAAMLMMKQPRSFNGVLLTDNTFGDILSDEAAVIPGSLGLLPSASLAGAPSGSPVMGLYEPVHGTAPDIAGKGIVNPAAQILSLALMLRYSFSMKAEATAVEKAVEKVIDSKEIGGREIRTGDLGGIAKTSEMGDAICEEFKAMLTKN